MGKFVITTQRNGNFYFVLKAGNGRDILSSEGYSSKTGCMNGIESVKRNSQDKKQYQQGASYDDKLFFVLKASNGQEIGRSEMYETKATLENGIMSVMKNAEHAEILDLS